MKKCLSLFIMIVCVGFCLGQQKSSINFSIKNLGINVDGHFNSFSVTIGFNDTNSLDYLNGNIKVESIDTGIDKRDEHLLEHDYFHALKYPEITIKTITIQKLSANTYSARASLKIKDKIKQITIPLSVEASGSSLKIISEFEINRRDFDVGGRSFVMSNTVKVKVIYFKKI